MGDTRHLGEGSPTLPCPKSSSPLLSLPTHRRDWTPRPIHSFNLNDLPPVSPNSSKKRKLSPEMVTLPISKYKFRDPRCVSDDESLSEDVNVEGNDIPPISIDWKDDKSIGDGFSHSVDVVDSNSLTSQSTNAMALDARSQTDILMQEALYDQPSYSSDSYGSNTCGNSPHSLDSRNILNSNAEQMFGSKLVEDEIHLDPENTDELVECESYKEQFETYKVHIYSETESNDTEQHAGDVDSMLCPNVNTSNASTTSTGRRREDKRIASKPTIDQEFEQYFSMLMLQDGNECNTSKNVVLF